MWEGGEEEEEEEEEEEDGGREGGWIKRNPPNTHVRAVSPASLGVSPACECENASTWRVGCRDG